MNKIWTETERNFIRENAADMKDRELAVKLTEVTGRNISMQAVRKQRQKLGIKKAYGRGKCAIVQQKSVSENIARTVVRPSV